jgi:hypothetical protein
MGLKEERAFRKWAKAERERDKIRRKVILNKLVCIICGQGWYGHNSYGDIKAHQKEAEALGKEQWVKGA